MRLRINIFKASTLIAILATTNALGQQAAPTPKAPECPILVYSPKEVDKKAKVLTYPPPNFDDRDLPPNPRSVIILRAIFCGNGEVTDVKVKRGISPKLDQETIRTAKTIKFRPAEKNGEKVSQWMTLEYHLND